MNHLRQLYAQQQFIPVHKHDNVHVVVLVLPHADGLTAAAPEYCGVCNP
jgi:hypothetical protein